MLQHRHDCKHAILILIMIHDKGEGGNYCIQVYHSLIQQKSLEIIYSLEGYFFWQIQHWNQHQRSKLVYLMSFEMNWQQTYMGSNLYVGWMRDTFIHDISLFLNAKPTMICAIRFLLRTCCPVQITLGQNQRTKLCHFLHSTFQQPMVQEIMHVLKTSVESQSIRTGQPNCTYHCRLLSIEFEK